jgi:16S rRNA (cytosine1402-N4)-methyltransferase
MKAEYHRPVLLQETVDLLLIRPGGVYVDATFGGGGHSAEILKRLGPEGRLIAFDKDPDARHNQIPNPKFSLVATDFRFIEMVLKGMGIGHVDGILADLGVSSHQFDEAIRGFSFRFDANLDMRMNPEEGISAIDLLNGYTEAELKRVLSNYGEVRQAGKIARMIVTERKRQPIETTADLERVVGSVIAATNLNKILTLVYQALRIEVNEELEALKMLLEGAKTMLRQGGRLAVISYHSLEDRLVKQYLRSGNLNGEDERDIFGRSLSGWKLITTRAIQPSAQEQHENPRSRSARLRVAERTEDK